MRFVWLITDEGYNIVAHKSIVTKIENTLIMGRLHKLRIGGDVPKLVLALENKQNQLATLYHYVLKNLIMSDIQMMHLIRKGILKHCIIFIRLM